MTSRLTVNKFIIYLVLIAFTAGCTTMRSLPATDAQSIASQIEVGDKIKIIRNDNTDVTFKVSAVSDEGISGDGAREGCLFRRTPKRPAQSATGGINGDHWLSAHKRISISDLTGSR